MREGNEDEGAGEGSEVVGLISGKKVAADEMADDDEGPPPRSRADIIALLAFALPLALTRGGQGAMQQTNVLFVGHLGTFELGSAALGNLWANVTGSAVIMGSLSALDSLAAQAFGAKSYCQIGSLTQCAILIESLVCIPVAISWGFLAGPVLTAVGIDPSQAEMAQAYSRILCLGLWPDAMTNGMQSFLQVQGHTRPPMIITTVAPGLNVGLNWWLVYGDGGYGYIGSPICMVIINWAIFVTLMLWVTCVGLHNHCWRGFDGEALREWGVMIKLGLSGIAAVMGEWWAWEIVRYQQSPPHTHTPPPPP